MGSLVSGRQWVQTPGGVAFPKPEASKFLSGLWLPGYANRLWTPGGFQAPGTDSSSSSGSAAGQAKKGDGSSTYLNWTITQTTGFPFVLLGVFAVGDTSSTNQLALGVGDKNATVGGVYGGLGQVSSGGTIAGVLRSSNGGTAAELSGPAALLGRIYAVARISRSTTSHTMYANGAKTTSSTDMISSGSDTYGNFTVNGAVRLTTLLFPGKQYTSLAAYGVQDPGDEWLHQFSLDPFGTLLQAPRRRLWSFAGLTQYLLAAGQGSYALSGQDAGVLASRLLAAGQGSYSLDGQSAGVMASRLLGAGQGSYSQTGNDAALLAARLLGAGQGSYSQDGQASGLLVSRLLSAGQGSYALDGQAASLVYTPLGVYTLAAGAGSYSVSGQDAGLLIQRLLIAAQGSYDLTGADAGLTRQFALPAGTGSYASTGQAAELLRTTLMTADGGFYILTGQLAGLSYSAAQPSVLGALSPLRAGMTRQRGGRPVQVSSGRRIN